MTRPLALVLALTWIAAGAACTSHTVKVEPIEVKPIHMTVDINVKVDRELDDFFDYEEELEVESSSAIDTTNTAEEVL